MQIGKITNITKRVVDIYENRGLRELSRRSYKMLNHPAFRHLKYTFYHSDAAAPIEKVIHIDPSEVNYLVVPRFQKVLHNRGYHVRGGEWDTRVLDRQIVFNANFDDSIKHRGVVAFDDFGLYQSIKNRFQHGYEWEETMYYQWEKKMHQKGLRNSSISAIRSRCERIDQLYNSIQSNGYQTQKQLGESVSYPERHEVMVDIGRDGQMFLDDGRHRLCIAKLLELDSIPVKILVRHRGWQQIRSQIINQGITKISKEYKNHPDILNINKDAT